VRILIIGTGGEIPPKGWGAVEAVLAEQIKRLPNLGVEVELINTLQWDNLVTYNGLTLSQCLGFGLLQ
jgi:hypothetical protein